MLLLSVERKMEDVGFWLRMLDWLMPLPPEAQDRVEAQVDRQKGGDKMPFVSFVDRWRQEAAEEGRKEGLEKGMEKGMEKGLRRGTLGMLKMRFGEAGAALAPRLEKAEAAALEAVCDAVERQASLEEIGKLLP
ncbi:MAG: hypothetical protein K2W96_15455 [Gemmataceae bacterium]|nr:hypothetical protein [Gemmataceae bacterium]